MARKLRNPGYVTLADFARKLGVSGQAVSQAVQSGRVRAFDGAGDRVPPGFLGRKWLKPDLAKDDWVSNRVRIDDPSPDDVHAAVMAALGALGRAFRGGVGCH
jgi:hypothetical protein